MGEHVNYSLSEAVQETTAGTILKYLPQTVFEELLNSNSSEIPKAALFAQMARFNTLYMVARAGSGHLGSSFSSLDIMTWLHLNVLNSEDRFFSSKGHDSPGLYSVHAALNVIPFEYIHALRRMNGLPGHPDVSTPGAHTNTGSLGMGVSKAKGFIFADALQGKVAGRVYVLTGDGELQEGQFWESLMSATRDTGGQLTVIVDHNKIQSDTYVASVNDLGDIEAKFRAFDCDVYRCDGHSFEALATLLNPSQKRSRTQVIIADTCKGRGVSFMEHTSMPINQEYYRFHSGAPSPEDYMRASTELLEDIKKKSFLLGLNQITPVEVEVEPIRVPTGFDRMIPAYTEAIIEEATVNQSIVALDADLVLDTGLIQFKKSFPERFVECGIAEQDMVSRAGTMALSGLLPIVHSFACFLTSRASEQIYNNCTERSKIIYMGALAGVLPGGPGHSHQAVRDITAMSSMPGIKIVEPVSSAQLKSVFHWAVCTNPTSTYLRVTSIPFAVLPEIQKIDTLIEGQGHLIKHGKDIQLVVAGPILISHAFEAAKILTRYGIDVGVIAMPWLNFFDLNWFRDVLGGDAPVMTIENHYADNGFGATLVSQLALAGILGARKVSIEGIKEIPACGKNDEVLDYHKLSSEKIAIKVRKFLGKENGEAPF